MAAPNPKADNALLLAALPALQRLELLQQPRVLPSKRHSPPTRQKAARRRSSRCGWVRTLSHHGGHVAHHPHPGVHQRKARNRERAVKAQLTDTDIDAVDGNSAQVLRSRREVSGHFTNST